MSRPITGLDPVTEEKINRNLGQFHCTTIGIAHRLSTIQDADTILALGDGWIVEQGSHEEPLRLGSYYAALIEAQTIRSPMRDWHNKSTYSTGPAVTATQPQSKPDPVYPASRDPVVAFLSSLRWKTTRAETGETQAPRARLRNRSPRRKAG
jgi:hypothetical protein